MERLTPEGVLKRYRRAKERRRSWEAHWQECYDFSLPQRDGFQHRGAPGEKKTDHLFDGTAADAVDQLAPSPLPGLTPPWPRWPPRWSVPMRSCPSGFSAPNRASC